MKTLTVKFPEDIDIEKSEVLFMLASKLYESGKLSIGQAAKVAGLTKKAFMEILGEYNVSVFNFSAEELAQDIKSA